jgi:DNA-binding beta-propeller fold protein YncE
MALQTTGPISLSNVNVELGLSSTALVSLNDAVVRSLLNVASGTISLYDAYGKSAGSTAWTLDNVTLSPVGRKLIIAQEATPTDIFFKTDGTKMYVLGTTGDDINEYDLSPAWSLSTASYLQNFSIAAQENAPSGLFFKPDGLKMYVTGSTGDDVNEYNLSTAWNITTASYVQSFSVAAQETVPQGVFFKPTGLKMYIMGGTGDDVNEYNLSTAWNVSTASYVQSFSVTAQETNPSGLFFKPDGTKMYVIGSTGDDIGQYSLSTAWNVSTASFIDKFDIDLQDTAPTGIFFKPDGLYMYTVGSTKDTVWGFNLSTAWDVSTAAFDNPFGTYLQIYLQEISPTDLFFKPDGTNLYLIGSAGDDINQYTLSTAWDIGTGIYSQVGSVATQEITPNGLFFKPDGLKMYVTGATGDDINEYNLSTAWSVSTLSFVQTFSIAAQETAPTGLFFKPDGLKMYVIGSTGDSIYEYNLSTAWNVSTLSYLQSFSVAAQDASPQGLFFKPEGTKMYVLGNTGDDVNEYDLSTAWNITTASYVQNYSVASNILIPQGLFFRPDGSRMYIVDGGNDIIWGYGLV